jgi:hypothetical protein
LSSQIHFRVRGLPAEPFRHLSGLSEDALRRLGARRYLADKQPGFSDRVEVRDGAIGERAPPLNPVHRSAATPHRTAQTIFVREVAEAAHDRVDQIPYVMRARLLSLGAFDAGT